MTGRRGRRHKQLLDDFKGMKRYWKLNDEALGRTLWKLGESVDLYGRLLGDKDVPRWGNDNIG